ncbi:MAG: 30S ribosomal protein S9 [Candidatus Pacearchaeota archaeon]
MNKEQSIVVSGKRKRSIARATIKDGTGKIIINKQPYELLPLIKRLMIEEPLEIAKEKLGKLNYDIEVLVKGGGSNSRIEAARLAIAKALVEKTKNNELKKAFLSYDRNLLVADVRRKEAYKPNDSKARAKRQKSYR